MFKCLSPISVKLLRDVLRNALNRAVKWGNVVLLVDPPKVEQRDITTLPPEQGQQLLDAAKGDRLEALYRVVLSLGLHEGEALGLRWQDVDLEQGTLRIVVALPLVRGKPVVVKPKTARSQRTLPLPSTLVTALRALRMRQLEDQQVAGSRSQEHSLVFASKAGTSTHPHNLLRAFYLLLERAELPHMRFHDLRHSCATLLAAQGVPARVAMAILEHSDIRTTLSVYTHVLDDSKRQAVEAMEHLFGATSEAS